MFKARFETEQILSDETVARQLASHLKYHQPQVEDDSDDEESISAVDNSAIKHVEQVLAAGQAALDRELPIGTPGSEKDQVSVSRIPPPTIRRVHHSTCVSTQPKVHFSPSLADPSTVSSPASVTSQYTHDEHDY
jgi:hypothetical protein